ncbi:pH signal transduction protein PalI [Trichophyton equinum CBS 127.97]|uniref:PH signal transduction protein PalI n=1 Tax=Trichophyton equinum (strain ATCC MYA-4606 / CBS 127.97) TaxID=559882 RepID=F2PLC0_TRIEC|nr:pH signal transduction protein PalI [Trichophyton equinum CBS 127.97]
MLLKPATPLSVLLFAAFALLLLSVLSTPVIKGIPLATYNDITFGVFGWCRRNRCSAFTIGYKDDARDGAFGDPNKDGDFNLPASIRHTLSSLLIVHPIAAFLTLICFGLAAAAHLHAPSHSPRYLLGLLILLLPTLLVSLLAFLVDILLFVPHLKWGGWIVLAATIILTTCGILTCAMRRTLVSRKARKRRIAENAEMNGENFYNRQNSYKMDPPSTVNVEAREDALSTVPTAETVATFARFESEPRPRDDDSRRMRPRAPPTSNERFWAPSETDIGTMEPPETPANQDGPYSRFAPPRRRPSKIPWATTIMEGRTMGTAVVAEAPTTLLRLAIARKRHPSRDETIPPGPGDHGPYPNRSRSGRSRRGGPSPGPPRRPRRDDDAMYGAAPAAGGLGDRDMEMERSRGDAYTSTITQSEISNLSAFIPARSGWTKNEQPLSPIDARGSPSPLGATNAQPRDMTRSPPRAAPHPTNTYYEDVETRFTNTSNPDPAFIPSALTPGSIAPEPDQRTSVDAVHGMRSPVSDISHFTSISQRGINPKWQPPEWNNPREKVQKQREALLVNNPDFQLSADVGRSNSARRGGRMPQVPAMPPMPAIPPVYTRS